MTCLRMIRPSETSFRIVWRELALEISFTSLGSSQILRLPHPTTEAASRFWVRRLTLDGTNYVSCGKDGIDEVAESWRGHAVSGQLDRDKCAQRLDA